MSHPARRSLHTFRNVLQPFMYHAYITERSRVPGRRIRVEISVEIFLPNPLRLPSEHQENGRKYGKYVTDKKKRWFTRVNREGKSGGNFGWVTSWNFEDIRTGDTGLLNIPRNINKAWFHTPSGSFRKSEEARGEGREASLPDASPRQTSLINLATRPVFK